MASSVADTGELRRMADRTLETVAQDVHAMKRLQAFAGWLISALLALVVLWGAWLTTTTIESREAIKSLQESRVEERRQREQLLGSVAEILQRLATLQEKVNTIEQQTSPDRRR